MGRRGFLAVVCHRPITPARVTEIFGAFPTSRQTRQDGVRLTASLDPALTLAAAPAITTWTTPVRLVWGARDQLFPVRHGRRLEQAFPRARLSVVPSSSTYVMLDAPGEIERAIDDLHRERPIPDPKDGAP